ncbi:MAG: BON domain-containing protein, partial [Epibacterium sp.]|nr:BON domain-containing protein [Epibacterium sp.]NQX75638.1 BON domain-containing protein [Epibacterium sp.]
MRLSSILIFATTFASAAGLSLIVAGFAATALEQGSEIAVRRALDTNGFSWTEVAADGLQVELSGQAPDEADRFAAISLVGGVVDAARVIDKMEVKPSDGIAPPRFSTEILRNDAGISIIGLIPESSNHTRILNSLQDLNEELPVTDFLETAAHRAPDDWNAALTFALEALALLPRSKISVQAGMVEIIAISDSPEAKAVLEQQLSRMLPANVKGQIEIAAPRPVISPFILRYVLDENGGRFDACSAESAQARVTILRAAQEAGLRATAECLIGLGVPSVNWAQAAIQAIHSLSMIGQGSVTLSNTDVTLVAAMGTEEALFERVAGELEQALPSVFALHAVLPKPEEDKNSDAQEFTATLSPEGQVQMRGRLADDLQGQTAQSYARARFGSQNVHL